MAGGIILLNDNGATSLLTQKWDVIPLQDVGIDMGIHRALSEMQSGFSSNRYGSPGHNFDCGKHSIRAPYPRPQKSIHH